MSNDPEILQGEIDRLRLQVESLQAKSGAKSISIGNYLLTRLAQLGATSMFGVPGDFNLGFLDLVEDHPEIDWVGNCNELNAAYAADGYARIKEGSLGVVTTTFGVGELSAINGIAGAFSEMVPVLHIVGVPSTTQQKNKPILHHTLGDGRYDAYLKAASQFTIFNAEIKDKPSAAQLIDQAITTCITRARPVYLTLPTDLVLAEVSSEPLNIPLSNAPSPNPSPEEEFVLETIQQRVKEAEGDVVVIIDACVMRHRVRTEVKDFLKQTGFPVYATPMGKTAINENYTRYGGVYIGSLTPAAIKDRVEHAKLIISIGSLASDFNTGNFSYNIPTRRHIELHSTYTQVQYAHFDGVGMKQLLPKLTEKLSSLHAVASELEVPKFVKPVPDESTDTITHAWFWPRVASLFRPNDIIVTETGTSNFGILDVPLPENTILVNQILWGSIGWSVGSCLGAALAGKAIGRDRVILFVGDGSLQLTVQEISTIIKKGLKPIIFVINNKGYSVEKFIHGKQRRYNDISQWNYKKILETFNDDDKFETASYSARTKQEVSALLDSPSFTSANKIQLVDISMEALDAPYALQKQFELSGGTDVYAPVQ